VDDALPLTVKFTPGTLRLSLVFVTLQYRLDVTSRADRPLRLRVQADLTSAHGSIDTREQLAPDPAQLELRHDVPVLAPEESVTLEGEVRVPLQDLRMLARGSARFVIPLVRLCLLTDAAAGRRVYTVGPQPSADAPLAPIRIDAGPRTHRELGWREIVAARGFALDPVRA
jgi:hypothetical protein